RGVHRRSALPRLRPLRRALVARLSAACPPVVEVASARGAAGAEAIAVQRSSAARDPEGLQPGYARVRSPGLRVPRAGRYGPCGTASRTRGQVRLRACTPAD